MGNLKMKLENHIKSFQIFLHDNKKCLARVNELDKFIQDKESKALKVQCTLESSSYSYNVISILNKGVCILKDEKAFLKSLLDDCEA